MKSILGTIAITTLLLIGAGTADAQDTAITSEARQIIVEDQHPVIDEIMYKRNVYMTGTIYGDFYCMNAAGTLTQSSYLDFNIDILPFQGDEYYAAVSVEIMANGNVYTTFGGYLPLSGLMNNGIIEFEALNYIDSLDGETLVRPGIRPRYPTGIDPRAVIPHCMYMEKGSSDSVVLDALRFNPDKTLTLAVGKDGRIKTFEINPYYADEPVTSFGRYLLE